MGTVMPLKLETPYQTAKQYARRLIQLLDETNYPEDKKAPYNFDYSAKLVTQK